MKRERIIRPLIVSFTLLLSAVVLTGCAQKPGAAAEVDGKIITEAQVEALTSELGEFYREGNIGSAPMRIEVVDSLVFKQIADSQSDKTGQQLVELDAKKLRSELKEKIQSGCKDGRAHYDAIKQNPEAAADKKELAKFKDQVDQFCAIEPAVDNLSDDAIVLDQIGRLKQQQGVGLAYPALKQQFPEMTIDVAPRYGKITDAGLQHNTPGSVFFIPRQ